MKNFVFMSEKKGVLGRQGFLTHFVCGPFKCQKNLLAVFSESNQKRKQDFATREVALNQKFFCTKIV